MKAYTAFVIMAAIIGGATINIVAFFFLLFLGFIALGFLGIDMASSAILTDGFLKKIIFASYASVMLHIFGTLRKYNRSHARAKNTRYEAIVFFGLPTILFFFSTMELSSFTGMCIVLTALGLYERIAIRYKGFGMYRYK